MTTDEVIASVRAGVSFQLELDTDALTLILLPAISDIAIIAEATAATLRKAGYDPGYLVSVFPEDTPMRRAGAAIGRADIAFRGIVASFDGEILLVRLRRAPRFDEDREQLRFILDALTDIGVSVDCLSRR